MQNHSIFKNNKKKFIDISSKLIINNLKDYFILASPFVFKSKLRNSDEILPKNISIFYHFLYIIFFTLINLIKRFNAKKHYQNNKDYQNIDNVYISHFTFTNNNNEKFYDNYFGEILYLGSSKNLIIYIPHKITSISSIVKKEFNNSRHKIIIIARYQNYFKEIIQIFKNFKKSFRFFISSLFTKNNHEKWFLKKTSLSLVSETTLQTLSDVNNIFNLLKNLNYKNLFLPFEGFSWERLLILKIKSQNNKHKIYGYINSGIFENQISIFLKINSKIYPDFLLTSGDIIKKYLYSKINININSIINIGSSRVNHSLKIKKQYKNNKDILFILEALDSEIDILLEFASELTRLNFNQKIYIKFHPLTNIKKYEKIFKMNKKLKLFKPSNINNIKYSIFRGSTAIIQLINYGIVPIYYNSYSLINLNPIFFYFDKNLIINNASDLNWILKNYSSISQTNCFKLLFTKSKFYYEPLKKDKFIKIISD